SSPGFRRYLRNAGTWVIELEKSQIADGKLRISTGGGVVGWFLRRFVIGGGLPAEIWAPGGVAGEAFASFIDGIAAANSKSGVRYIGKATPRIEYVPSGQPYLRAIAQLFDEAKDFVNMQAFDWKV